MAIRKPRLKPEHLAAVNGAFRLRPVPTLSLPEWADTFRHLSGSAGAISGPWRTERVEVARGAMMAVKEPGVRTITVKCSTQTMKTSLLENVIGYQMHQEPCPMLLIEPKEGAVKAFAKERFMPMIRATKVLAGIVGDVARDKSGDSMSYRPFPGGFLALESAGSPTNLAMRAIRITLLDEIDKYELTKEGDPVLLAEERTATFSDALHIRVCSPTHVDTSRIEKSYNSSDQRRPYVACPHCQHWQTLEFFKHVEWNKSEDGETHHPMTAAIFCESCGAEWLEAQRLAIITTAGSIRWHQTRPFECCGISQDPQKTRSWEWDPVVQCGYATCTECGKRAVSNAHAGFTCSKLYSPFITIPELAEKWLAAKNDSEARMVFYNTQLGLAYTTKIKEIEPHKLAERRETFRAPVPRGGAVLTCGVDVQDDRIEAHVVAWGRDYEAFSVDYRIFPMDPGRSETWSALDAFLKTPYRHEAGADMLIRGVCVDSGGHHTETVYRFCRPRLMDRVWAVKGSSWAKSGDPVWPKQSPEESRRRRVGFKPVIINVNAAKEFLFHNIASVLEPGPRYFHIPV